MSLLDGLDDGFVSSEFFRARNWMYKNLPHFTGYFKAHLTMVKLPQDSEMSPFNFKVIYIPESRISNVIFSQSRKESAPGIVINESILRKTMLRSLRKSGCNGLRNSRYSTPLCTN